MSSKLFAFNVSKKTERMDEKAQDQWIGDQTARQEIFYHCTNATNYGVAHCVVYDLICYSWGGQGYYLCDNY